MSSRHISPVLILAVTAYLAGTRAGASPKGADVTLDEYEALMRRRYECTCGYHGYRESHALPSHIKCPRCGGVAVATGQPELVK